MYLGSIILRYWYIILGIFSWLYLVKLKLIALFLDFSKIVFELISCTKFSFIVNELTLAKISFLELLTEY